MELGRRSPKQDRKILRLLQNNPNLALRQGETKRRQKRISKTANAIECEIKCELECEEGN